ncbi:MAG: pyridoxal phosphate-dependent aminotransferase [Candidatus Hodarchaeota archaeon]
MKELSQNLSKAPKSKIRELFDIALGKSDVISLGIGQPDFPTPEPAIRGTIEALKKGITSYAPTRGLPELLELIESKLKNFNNIETNWKENIIVTNGGSQALCLTYASLFNPGDELIILSPNFLSYFYIASFFGVKVVEIERNPDFSPNFEKLEKAITEKTKAIIINSPNNPTGYAFSSKELKEIVNIIEGNDLFLISDEVYENYLYDGLKHLSPASFDEMFDRTITTNAMSKLFSATGFRLGYAVASKEIINYMEKFHQYTVAGTNHAAQYGFIEALKMDLKFFEKILKSFDERRNLVYDRLKNIGFDVVKPRGAFYVMPSLKKFNMTGSEFSTKIMKTKGVAVIPGDTFGSFSNFMVRISYATAIDKIKEAMDRIEEFINEL